MPSKQSVYTITNKSGILLSIFILISVATSAQLADHVKNIFPENTKVYGNIPYANDTSPFHLPDVYLPAIATKRLPLV